MNQPPHFREDRLEVQHALIRAHPLGLLVTVGPEGAIANAIPFLLDADASDNGTLRAHLSRGNGQWHTLDGAPALVVFQGPQGYITPSWYETKRETGKVVPTWNYAMVQARGTARLLPESEWLGGHVRTLTDRHEAGEREPWRVDDAPERFIEAQLKGIIGLEIAIDRIEGKWKVSQNRAPADRKGVAEGLRARAGADALADLVTLYGKD